MKTMLGIIILFLTFDVRIINSQDFNTMIFFFSEEADQDTIPPDLLFALKRQGIPYNQGTHTKIADRTGFAIDTIPTLKIPQLALIEDFNLLGNDYYGFIGTRVDGKYYRTTNGTSFAEVIPDTSISQMWCDDFGNKYIKTSAYDTSIYRATKDSWDFEKAFAYSSGYADFLSFFCYDNIVMFSAYGALNDESNRGVEIAVSTNAGEDWNIATVDSNQRHLHSCIYNPQTGKMYAQIGEYSSTLSKKYRGVAVSADSGTTWTSIIAPDDATYDDQYQYTSAWNSGTNVYFGSDKAPSTMFLLDSSDIITQIPALTESGGGYASLYQGYHLGATLDNGLVYVQGTGSSGSPNVNANYFIIDTTTNIPCVVWSPKWAEQRLHYRLLSVPNLNVFAIKDIKNIDTKSYLMTKSSISNKEYYYIGKSADTIKVLQWDGQSDVIEETFNGYPIVKVHRDGVTNNGGYFDVETNQYVDLTFLVKKQTGGTLKAILYWGNSVGGQRGSTSPLLYLTNLNDTSNFHKVTIPRILIPDSSGGDKIAKMKVFFYITDGDVIETDPTNYHYIVGRAVLSKSNQTNYQPWFGDSSFADEIDISFSKNLSGSFLLKDRIYQLGRSINYFAGFTNTLLQIYGADTITVAMERPIDSTHYSCYLKITEGDSILGRVRGGFWGGSLDMDYVDLAKVIAVDGLVEIARPFPNGVIPAPIIVGLTKTQIHIYSPETGEVESFNLLQNLEGGVTGTLYGDAYHRPEMLITTDVINTLLQE